MDLVKHVSDSVADSSQLPPQVMAVHGFTGEKIRTLLNRLGRHPFNYLEIGVHLGATFIAANYGNAMNATAVDDWSGVGTDLTGIREGFKENVMTLLPGQQITLLERDCFSVESLPQPIDFYFYDGNHSEQSQCRALTHFYSMLADEFVFCVDDWDWPTTKAGTYRAIADLKLDILASWDFEGGKESDPANWWNGFFVAVLKKTQG